MAVSKSIKKKPSKGEGGKVVTKKASKKASTRTKTKPKTVKEKKSEMNSFDNSEETTFRYQKAKKRVEQLKSFYTHLTVYLVVNLFLILVNFLVSSDSLWFYWPMLGWGIGLISHGLSVLGVGLFDEEWEEEKIKEILNKSKNK